MERAAWEIWTAFRNAPGEATFEPVYASTHRLVYTICRRRLRAHEDAMDAFQMTYTRLIAHAHRPEPDLPENDLASLAGVLASREAGRLEQRRARLHRKEASMETPPEIAESRPDAGETLAAKQEREKLEALVALLPDRERLAVELHYFHGLTQTAIATMLETDKSTVSRRIQRGLKRLQPMARRAGLGDSPAMLGAAAVVATLLSPPGAVAAGVVYADAIAAGAAAGFTGGGGISLLMKGTIMKAKTAWIAGLAAVALIGVGTVALRGRAPAPTEAPTDRVEAAVTPAERPIADATANAAREPGGSSNAGAIAELVAAANETADRATTTATVVGRVTDARTGAGLPFATVELDKSKGALRATADARGDYILAGLPPGERLIVVAGAADHVAEAAVTRAGPGEQVRVDIALEAAGRARVRVRDRDGRPIQGTRLLTKRAPGDHLDDAGPRTDARGESTVEGLALTRPTSIGAEKQGYEREWTEARFADGSRETTVEVTLGPERKNTIDFEGTIGDEAGAPLEGIEVFYAESWMTREAKRVRTDAQGHYALGTGEYVNLGQLYAVGEGWATIWRMSPQPTPTGEPLRVDFTMVPEMTLEGRVVDESGRPLEGIGVDLSPTTSEQARLPGSQEDAGTDADGRFRYAGIAPGQYRLIFRDPGGRYDELYVFTQAGNRIEATMLTAGRLIGRVEDELTGKPVPRFRILTSGYVLNSRGAEARRQVGDAFDDKEGRFEVGLLRRNYKMRVTLEAEDYAPKILDDIVAGGLDAEPMVVRMKQAAALRGRVVDATTGLPIQGANVHHVIIDEKYHDRNDVVAWRTAVERSNPDNRSIRQSTATDFNGAFEIVEGDKPGYLYVRAAGRARMRIAPDERAPLVDREGRLAVALEPGATIRGHCAPDNPKREYYLLSLSAVFPPARTGQRDIRQDTAEVKHDSRGNFVFDDLAAGTYEIQGWAWHGDVGSEAFARRVVLKPGETANLDLAMERGDAGLAGIVTLEGNPSPNARVTFEPAFEWEYRRLTAICDHDGVYSIDGLRPGKYSVQIRFERAEGRSQYSPPSEIVVEGIDRHDFDVPASQAR